MTRSEALGGGVSPRRDGIGAEKAEYGCDVGELLFSKAELGSIDNGLPFELPGRVKSVLLLVEHSRGCCPGNENCASFVSMNRKPMARDRERAGDDSEILTRYERADPCWLGEYVYRYRVARGFSLGMLSDLSRMKKGRISRIENGARCRPSTFCRLLNPLGERLINAIAWAETAVRYGDEMPAAPRLEVPWSAPRGAR